MGWAGLMGVETCARPIMGGIGWVVMGGIGWVVMGGIGSVERRGGGEGISRGLGSDERSGVGWEERGGPLRHTICGLEWMATSPCASIATTLWPHVAAG